MILHGLSASDANNSDNRALSDNSNQINAGHRMVGNVGPSTPIEVRAFSLSFSILFRSSVGKLHVIILRFLNFVIVTP